MEERERTLIRRVLQSNGQLKRLYDEHLELERKLSLLQGRTFLTQREQVEAKKLKARKLQGVDKMMRILSAYEAERPEQIT